MICIYLLSTFQKVTYINVHFVPIIKGTRIKLSIKKNKNGNFLLDADGKHWNEPFSDRLNLG